MGSSSQSRSNRDKQGEKRHKVNNDQAKRLHDARGADSVHDIMNQYERNEDKVFDDDDESDDELHHIGENRSKQQPGRRGTNESRKKQRVSMSSDDECVPQQKRNNKTQVQRRVPVPKRKQPSDDESGEEDTDEQTDKENKKKESVRNVQKEKEEYIKQMTDFGHLQDIDSQRVSIKNNINKKLFRKVKFITHENQMDVQGEIATKVMNDLNVPEERREAYWLTHRTFVTKTLRSKRNNISMTLKDAYMSTYNHVSTLRSEVSESNIHYCVLCTEHYKDGNEITMEQVLRARENIEDFTLFCDTFMSNVVGRNIYNSKVGEARMSKIATVGDEAFALVCVENSIERWKDEVSDQTKANKSKWRPSKYTANPSEARKYGGWSLEGIRRFNELSRTGVPELRFRSKDIENEYFLQENGKRNKVKTPRRSKSPTIDECDVPYRDPMDDEDDDDTSTVTDELENNEDTEPIVNARTCTDIRGV
jgi:hypothetical protein